ncbi:SH3 domain-containing protein [Pseudalkalibacillus berkeleyi]|uniref:SH3 domain-containing protein n=1 Tax=Pseudalkalibacillus berkeleyi TaxID=1069813 RepID=A0ABS9GZ82_9BACL|nr:SH3 domain-containing protein [Pseudalkalibacillus berkeleyi]MCF6138058.1 SH3 domain-containing protein [Pseudalkalibacillus berkeleyi]
MTDIKDGMKKWGGIVKKCYYILLTMIFLLSSFTTVSQNGFAADRDKAKITVDTLNVRSGPGLGHSVVGQVHKNKEYPILSEKGDWLQIQMNGKRGWIAGWYAKKIKAQQSENDPSSNTGIWISSKVDALNVRSGPDTSFTVVGQIYPHEKFQSIDTKGSWTKIKYKNREAWVASWLTQSSTPSSEKKKEPEQSSDKSIVNATSLNVRSGPGTSYSVVGSLRKGDHVEIIQIQNGWYKVSYQNGKGWVAGRYVTKSENEDKQPSTPPTAPTSLKKGKITATILNVRDKGSLQGKVVGQLKKNQIVEILKVENKWAYVQWNQSKGWAASWFIEEVKEDNTSQPEGDLSNEPSLTLLYDGTNLRSGPSTKDSVVDRGNKGDQFPILSKEGDWFKIKLSSTKEAYVAGWIVSVTGASTPEVNHPTVGDYLKGKTVVIDAGHGGNDGGAVGTTYGTLEKVLNLNVAKAVSSKLKAAGAKVVMTRSDNQYISLPYRVYLAHTHSADAFISVHFNSSIFPSAKGVNSFYYSKLKDAPLAHAIQDELVRQTGLRNRGVKFGNFQVLRTNHQPATLLELGFISNSQEEHYVRSAAYTDKAGHAIYRGLAKFFSNR